MKEEWKAVKGYEGFYEVSTTGKVRSVERIIHDKKCDRIFKGQELHPTEHNGKQPYYYVSMCRNGKSHKELVHRLVATTFLPNADDFPQVNHKDGNVHNNSVENLEWVTNAENTFHAYSHQLRKKNVIWISDGVNVYTLRNLCKQLNLNYKKVHSRYKYCGWNINKCLEVKGGDVYHVEII